jgi:hypothetical protein
MTKTISKLPIEYLVIKCATPDGSKGLGILGRIILPGRPGLFFFAGGSPKSIKGFDPFEMKIVSAAPESVRNDVRHFLSEKVPPEKVLAEVSRHYRGTIFASERLTDDVSIRITPATTPQQLISCFAPAIMRIAIKEKVSQPPRKRTRRGAKSARTRSTTAVIRRYNFPRLEFMESRASI